uniref:Uncharacterized protein n=1 Tax=uncultured Caudovirales phage TaxID=2100421 RepID=A0A6J5L785_9CAUD|nr:hypothetical protein UFOVP114_39 [uncultured Caudovirales phage]
MALSSVTVQKLGNVRAILDATLADADPARWTVTTPPGAQPVCVVQVSPETGMLGATLWLSTLLTPGATYQFQLDGGTAVDCVVDDGILPEVYGDDVSVLDALTQAIGEECQNVAGVPATRLIDNLADGATTAYVESTLNFPSKGEAWIGPRLFTYSSLTDNSLRGLALLSVSDGQPIPMYSLVVCNARAVLPD